MGMSFQWHNEHVIHVQYEQRVDSWDEYYLVNAAVNRAVRDSGPPTTIYVIHTPGKVPMPKGNPLPHLQRVARLLPAHVVTYTVVENYFANMMLITVFTLLEKLGQLPPVYAATSFEDALRQIAQRGTVVV
jgi:hypothetical protein